MQQSAKPRQQAPNVHSKLVRKPRLERTTTFYVILVAERADQTERALEVEGENYSSIPTENTSSDAVDSPSRSILQQGMHTWMLKGCVCRKNWEIWCSQEDGCFLVDSDEGANWWFFFAGSLGKMSSKLPSVLSATEEDIRMLLAAKCHIGTKNCEKSMESYVWKRRQDGARPLHLLLTVSLLRISRRNPHS